MRTVILLLVPAAFTLMVTEGDDHETSVGCGCERRYWILPEKLVGKTVDGMSVTVLHQSSRDQFTAKVMVSVSLKGASFANPDEPRQDALTCLMTPQRVKEYASACVLPSEASVTV